MGLLQQGVRGGSMPLHHRRQLSGAFFGIRLHTTDDVVEIGR